MSMLPGINKDVRMPNILTAFIIQCDPPGRIPGSLIFAEARDEVLAATSPDQHQECTE